MSTRHVTFSGLTAFVIFASIACLSESSDKQRESSVSTSSSCPTHATATFDDTKPTSDQVLNQLAGALNCPGHVAHLVAEVEQGTGEEPAKVEYWLDLQERSLRMHSGEGARYAPEEIANDDGVFLRYSGETQAEKSEYSPWCLQYDEPLLAYVVDDECFLLGRGPEASVESAEYDGRTVVVLRSKQLFPYGPDEDDGIATFDSRVYVDPATFVLLGVAVTGTLNGLPLTNEEFSVKYDLDFIPSGSVASDWFEPSSIGYVQPNAEIDRIEGVPYWLGETLPAARGFSELTIGDVWLPDRAIDPGDYIGIVYYEPDVALHEYDATQIDDEEMDYWQQMSLAGWECLAETIEVDLSGARAVIWGKGRKAPDGACGQATHYEARAFFEETMVTIITSENSGAEFDSPEGMEHILRALTRKD